MIPITKAPLSFSFSEQFQEILKPNYNSVDLAEVELPMNFVAQPEPRANDSELLAVRKGDSKFIDFFKRRSKN